MGDEMEQVATMMEGESFYSSLRTMCWDACVHSVFDKEAAIQLTYQKKRGDRMEPYDPCLRRCLGRLNTSHEEISEEFMKQAEEMAKRMQEREAAMQQMQGGGPRM